MTKWYYANLTKQPLSSEGQFFLRSQ